MKRKRKGKAKLKKIISKAKKIHKRGVKWQTAMKRASNKV